MIDVERMLADAMELVVAVPSGASADWNDVVNRAGVQHRRPRFAVRRRFLAIGVALACTAAVVASVSPARSAIVDLYSNFNAWIIGTPGTAVSEADQKAFEIEHRQWTGFPEDAQLRQLTQVETDRGTFTLFGYRAGDTLCLRVAASDGAHGTLLSCIPVAQLQHQPSPAVVVAVDFGFDSGSSATLGDGVLVTAGIVADGIRGVELEDSKGVQHSAVVANDAFISAEDATQVANPTTHVVALDASGTRFEIPLALAPYGTQTPAAPGGTAPGPTVLDRHVDGGTIGWLDDRRSVGEPAPTGLRLQRGTVIFRRMLRPDGQSDARVVVSLMGAVPLINQFFPGKREICFELVGLGGVSGGCSTVELLFQRAPFTTGESIITGSDQRVTLYGVASDDVQRLELYLSDGEILPVPLQENTYVIGALRSAFPARIVGYDRDDRVIGSNELRSDGIAHG